MSVAPECALRAVPDRPRTAYRADELMAIEFPAPRWAVPGLIAEGVTLLAGPPKVGKSWLLLSTALSIASGSQILGALNGQPPRPVLYLALEDSDRRMKDRCAQLGWNQVCNMERELASSICAAGR